MRQKGVTLSVGQPQANILDSMFSIDKKQEVTVPYEPCLNITLTDLSRKYAEFWLEPPSAHCLNYRFLFIIHLKHVFCRSHTVFFHCCCFFAIVSVLKLLIFTVVLTGPGMCFFDCS